MPNYLIDKTSTKNSVYILHEIDCPRALNKKYYVKIGYFTDCSSALRYLRVKNSDKNFSGCKYCCRSCWNKK